MSPASGQQVRVARQQSRSAGQVQSPPQHCIPTGQISPHSPQLRSLKFKLTHLPLQQVSFGLQGMVHPPQWAASVLVSTRTPLQPVNPWGQAGGTGGGGGGGGASGGGGGGGGCDGSGGGAAGGGAAAAATQVPLWQVPILHGVPKAFALHLPGLQCFLPFFFS